jgi:putative transposase
MDEPESLSHTKWECKYHVIFIPKCRRRTLYTELRKHLGRCFAGWLRKRKAGSKRVTLCPITCIC